MFANWMAAGDDPFDVVVMLNRDSSYSDNLTNKNRIQALNDDECVFKWFSMPTTIV